MKINFKSNELKELLKFQEGGVAPEAAPVEEPAPAPEEAAGGSPEELIIQAAALAVQTQDAQLALQVCLALVEMAGSGAPAQPEGEPVYRRGGQLKYWKK